MNGRLVFEARIVTGEGGGPDKTILNTPRFLKDRGYPTVCVYLRHPKDSGFSSLSRRAEEWQAPIEAIDDWGPFDVGVIRRLRELCQKYRPAIWHGHDYKTNFLGLILARSVPMKLVTTVHGWVKHTWKTPIYYAVDRWCLKRYARVLCVSQDLYDECVRNGVSKEHCALILNGIDVEQFRRRRTIAEAKEALGIPPNRLVVGAVGRLSEEKGFQHLISAMSSILQSNVDCELRIAGEGDFRNRLQSLIDSLGMTNRIHLVGFQNRHADFYEALDVFALSSLREGLPNVILEAMAFGNAIVATNIAGVPSAIHDHETGLLIKPNSITELEASLRTLLSDTSLRNQLGSAARRRVESEFSFGRRMDRIVEIYDEIMESVPCP
jgi:glycosyltransferase involved in cell wall biosynthesis